MVSHGFCLLQIDQCRYVWIFCHLINTLAGDINYYFPEALFQIVYL